MSYKCREENTQVYDHPSGRGELAYYKIGFIWSLSKIVNMLLFDLGLCGRDGLARVETLIAKGAVDGFWSFFPQKRTRPSRPMRLKN